MTDDGGDYTVHVVVGMDPQSRLYVLDLWREQTSSEKWIEAFCDLVLHWKPLDWAEEQGQIKASVGPFLSRRQHERKAYVNRLPFPTRGNKAVRAQSIPGPHGARKAICPGARAVVSGLPCGIAKLYSR